eukprot:NODE_1119_length_1571_cov_13.088042_g922_i0.p1 GENE.NODE_1119_length_1571_cov_13.088042_g922_i0~~NODE_1119_length_1571_cov_13.088042_g922_i0.p1  ORF type:complete len:308 (+),score=20.74 NODE_1119_length_1571_cov_13.088042_g922_i0:605-1528(+)
MHGTPPGSSTGVLSTRCGRSWLHTLPENTQTLMVDSIQERPGGCGTTAKFTRNFLGGKITSLPTAKNQCGVGVFHHVLKLNRVSAESRAKTTRKKAGIKHEDPLSPSEMKQIAVHLSVGCELYDYTGKMTDLVRPPPERPTVQALLMNGHWYHYEPATRAQKCRACGREYLITHTCNPERASFYTQQKRNIQAILPQAPNKNKFKSMQEVLGSVCHYDLETFEDQVTREHVIYAVGWKFRGQYQVAHGILCEMKFIEWLEKHISEVSFISAYNGSRYDALLLLRPLESRGFESSKMILSGGGLLSVT